MSVPTRTSWRRCVGVVEDDNHDEFVGGRVAARLSRWLSTCPTTVQLQLVFKFGGANRSVAWLGLTEVLVSGSRQSGHDEVLADLAEALDAWELYLDIPRSGPRYAQTSLGLVTVAEGAPIDDFDDLPSLLQAIDDLASRDAPRALVFTFQPRGTAPDLLRDVDSARQRAARLHALPRMFAFLDRASVEVYGIRDRLTALRQNAADCALTVVLHGPPPGSILRDGLEGALGTQLDRTVQFQDGPAETLTGQRRPITAMLSLMAAGSTGAARSLSQIGDLDIPF